MKRLIYTITILTSITCTSCSEPAENHGYKSYPERQSTIEEIDIDALDPLYTDTIETIQR